MGPSGILITLLGGVIIETLLHLNKKNKSDIWFERTERRTYKAPTGHFIYADPTY
jgi:hypothetical protein